VLASTKTVFGWFLVALNRIFASTKPFRRGFPRPTGTQTLLSSYAVNYTVMNRKVTILLDEVLYFKLRQTQAGFRKKSLSHSINHYVALGLSIGNRFELAWPVVLEDLRETTARIAARAAEQAKNSPLEKPLCKVKRLQETQEPGKPATESAAGSLQQSAKPLPGPSPCNAKEARRTMVS